MKLHLNENLFEEYLVEYGYKGEGNLAYALVDIINVLCKTNLNGDKYMVHHLDYQHNDFHLTNLILLPIYDKKIPGIQYVNPNSAVHSRFRDINVINIDDYLKFLKQIKAIDAYLTIVKGTLTYV